MNGINGDTGQGADPDMLRTNDAIQAQAMAQKLHDSIRQVLGTVIRGVMVSAPGVPPELILNAISQQTGYILASSVQGDLPTVLQIRRRFKESFEAGVKSAQIVSPPMPSIPEHHAG